MDRELEEYYTNQFDMMASQGWKDLMQTVDAMLKKELDVMSIKDAEDLYKRQGRLDILNWVANWKETCEATMKIIQDEENL